MRIFATLFFENTMVQLHDLNFEKCISATEVQQAVNGVAIQINHDYKEHTPVFLTVLNGAFLFAKEMKYRPLWEQSLHLRDVTLS